MMDWTITIEAGGDLAAEQIDLDCVDALADALADRHAAATTARRRYGAQFDVDAPTAEKATEVALATFCMAVEKAKLPDWPIIHVELMTVEDQQAALAEPTFPDILGVTEAAQLLGVSRQRLAQLASRDDFPEPMVRLAAGPVWLRSSIEWFERRWLRKPGRPAKPAKPAQRSMAPPPRAGAPRRRAVAAKRASGGGYVVRDAKAGKTARTNAKQD